tara:strand:- start:793 stop:1077 length:285 start_codon:yes stop_codon:yes gene_type:complete
MARYPALPVNIAGTDTKELRELYQTIESWSALLLSELDSRDIEVESTPSTNIYAVVTITSIGRPRKGDIAYSASSGKYKGYVSVGSTKEWQNLN